MIKKIILVSLLLCTQVYAFNWYVSLQQQYKYAYSYHSRVISIAESYIGYGQYNNYRILNSFTGMNIRDGGWCAGFVNAVLRQAGLKGTNSVMARSFLHWGTSTNTPVQGDIVVFRDLTQSRDPAHGHVGFYMYREGDYIMTLGGNEDKQVKIKGYPVSYVIGYRTY